jgi:hypothetical protein
MFEQRLIEMLQSDPMRMESLLAVQQLALPDCYIAAGFVRNLVWDYLHQSKTPLNDIDVIFFDDKDPGNITAETAQHHLNGSHPKAKWQVKNQAVIHTRNGDPAYQNSLDAMSFWPEKETALAVRLNQNNQLEIISAFPENNVFEGNITHNPKREYQLFEQRIAQKNWLKIWPSLKIRS